jgi:hypothetical protein
MKSYTMSSEQASRYDNDDMTVYQDIKSALGISNWTPGVGNGDSVEVHHPEGFVAEVFYAPDDLDFGADE